MAWSGTRTQLSFRRGNRSLRAGPVGKRNQPGDASMATTTYGTLSASEHSANLRKAVIASTIGTTIEWYDFFIYGTAAGLVFGKLYFPNEDALTATLAAFGTYFIGFVGRPIGAAIFGHYGDRIGRKATLIATLLLMGLATAAVAIVPTYESIGIWGAVRTVPRQPRGAGVQPDVGGAVPELGLAYPVRAQPHPGRRRPLHPARHPGNPGVRPTAGREQSRAHADADGDQTVSPRNPALRLCAHGRAGAVLYLHRVHLFLRHRHPAHVAQLPVDRGDVGLRA